MSFVGLSGAPALSLEETLALLDAFGDGAPDASPLSCSESCSSGGGSPEDAAFDELEELLPAISSVWDTTTTSDDSEALSRPPVAVTGTTGDVSNRKSEATMSSASQSQVPPQRSKRKTTDRLDAPSPLDSDDEKDHVEKPPMATNVVRKRRVRKQPKTEILRLRDEAEELQMRLRQLQKAAAAAASGTVGVDRQWFLNSSGGRDSRVVLEPPCGDVSWLDIAVDQFKALQRADALNDKLKAEVARQTRFGAALKTQFTKKIAQQVQQGPAFVQVLEPAALAPASPIFSCYERNEGDSDADALAQCVQKMHIDADWLRREIAAESDASAMFNSSKLTLDRTGGPAFEFKTNTLIDHADFHRVGFAMWHRATTVGDDHRSHVPVHDRGIGVAEVHQRPVAMTLSSRSETTGDVLVNGVVVLCKVDTTQHSVFTFASTLAVGGSSAFVLREHGWMIFAPHETDVTKSVFQVFYRLASETRVAPTALSATDVAVRQTAVKAMSDNIKFFLTDVQHLFGEHSDFFDLSHFPVSCPLHKVYIE